MKKLRRSRLAKFISLILAFILSAGIVFNIAGTVILMKDNLFYANSDQFKQKVYLHLYNHTASDLMNYLNLTEDIHCNSDNYKSYHTSEIELYQSKYSPEKSNIYFEILDEQGNILLNNKNKVSDNCFSFSQHFLTDSFTYSFASSDKNIYSPSENVTSLTEESTIVTQENTTVTPEADEATEDTESQTANPQNLADNDKDFKTEEIYIENINSGNNTLFIYRYRDEIDDNIFEHCANGVKHLSYDISVIIFYQDEFSYDSTDNTVYQTYSYNDDKLPEKSFVTTLLSKGKSAEIKYSYKGTFNIAEFTDRLSHSAIILSFSDKNEASFEYRQKKPNPT